MIKRFAPLLSLAAAAVVAFFLTRAVAGNLTAGPDQGAAGPMPKVVALHDGQADLQARQGAAVPSAALQRPTLARAERAAVSTAAEPLLAPGRVNVEDPNSCADLANVPDQLIERTPFKDREAFTRFVEANKTRIVGLQQSVDGAMRDRVNAARECVGKKHPEAAPLSSKVKLEFTLQATPSTIALSRGVVTDRTATIPQADLDECLRPVLEPLDIKDSGDLYFDYNGPYPYKLSL